MIIGFNHFSFTISDIERSVKYYRDAIGMELISFADRPPDYVQSVTGIKTTMRVAYLKKDNFLLELIEYSGKKRSLAESKANNIGSGHICFNVDDIDQIIDEMKEKGVEFIGLPIRIPGGANEGGLVVYAKDPDGIVTEFIQPPHV